MSERLEIRPIPGHPLYGASRDGRIWSCRRGEWCALVSSPDGNGQPKIKITGGKTYKVHTLVALTYLGPRPPKHDVDHRDGNKQNCAVENLDYCTRSENVIRALKAGRQPPPPAWVRRRPKPSKRTLKRMLLSQRRAHEALELKIHQIPGHPNYGVTAEDGQAWSFASKKTWRKLVHTADGRGFPKVKLGKGKTVLVHEVVARIFIGPRPKGAVITQLDRIRWNTAASNLRYETKSANNLLAWAEGSQSAGWNTRTARLRSTGHTEWGPNGSYPASVPCQQSSKATGSAEQLLQQSPEAESGSGIDTVVCGAPWIGQPAPTARCLEAETVPHSALP